MGTEAKIDGNGNIVIQRVEGSTITINPSIPDEVRKALIDHQSLIAELPNKILQILMDNNAKEPPVIGANIYLGLNLMAGTYGIAGISISVQITNLTKKLILLVMKNMTSLNLLLQIQMRFRSRCL